ncbi:cob(I)yrinic acid a,c-diamide adenosyltransferase [Methermicoccus shengliensis]|uniref:Cob(I)yrinic acid a,c-diamide adenosyltransferase n=1 Tax=Methermicoccus shengliensis TaxID=660064 RepID=A0A832RUW2_9EURY|nr:cob(I)yrinic acid a,c-diamide adenosyltransferase [Methermicoccus shengliensis]KUK04245.1 MAG: Cob(I)alamin adenosyltransferase [Euryarchaeota archaeon 55_53]KUK29868.1 MAG: Cob(I)alamin adenosyltransferase [Methanosarcinales archeaon 56_1174]MDI3488264.1 cob(I)alamin adenosyltransferase [Methanosarcinales archaeon]MDN5295801.1 cob(I)alamin adenosyltransferase [Methanosarcinales archaeon]HIH69255.1 cob(I)yrinic acid a,c-diamide adenosyltransferase [Methermicoccus shengliensis]
MEGEGAKLRGARIYVFTGTGVGKTTAAVGRAIRFVGEGKRVVMVQFMKGRNRTGEYLIQQRLYPDFQVYQCGRPGWVDLENPSQQDRDLAHTALERAKELAKIEQPDMLILDEVNLACHIGLIGVDEVLELLDELPEDMAVILTGRYAPVELVRRADVVSEILDIKHP